eukprot:NODE_209_length_14693_cov_0.335617.p3 type:complete len:449 gc:universal NODE_209_length_14693_cov_0.335617:10038-11384(+)
MSSQPEDPSINCFCRKKVDDGFTIQCERCLLWCHAKCYKIDSQAVPAHFYCMSCQNTDTESELVDEDSYINWGDRIIKEYKYGIHVGDKPSDEYTSFENAAFLIFPKPKLKKTPILRFMKFKSYDKIANDLYLSMPGQTSWQRVCKTPVAIANHSLIHQISDSFVESFHSQEEIRPTTLCYFSPNSITLEDQAITSNKYYRKGCIGNLKVTKSNGQHSIYSIDDIQANEELILQYSDVEFERAMSWSFQEFLSGCTLEPKSCILLTCASCKYSEFKNCLLYLKLLKNSKLDVTTVRGDQPALNISPVEPKRKRGRPPKLKKSSSEDNAVKKKKQSPKIQSRKQSANNSPIIAPKLNPMSPSQMSEADIDDLIPQINVFDDPISDLTYIQIGNGMVVKRARLKTCSKIPSDWKCNKVASTSMRRMNLLTRYRQELNEPRKILKIADFLK